MSTSWPVSVTRIVCSCWQAREPSFVTMFQPSSKVWIAGLSIVIIGSRAKVMPGLRTSPVFALPWFGMVGSSCNLWPTPWPVSSLTML